MIALGLNKKIYPDLALSTKRYRGKMNQAIAEVRIASIIVNPSDKASKTRKSRGKVKEWEAARRLTGISSEKIPTLKAKLKAGKEMFKSRLIYLSERVDGFENDQYYLTALIALSKEYYSRSCNQTAWKLYQAVGVLIRALLPILSDSEYDTQSIYHLTMLKRPKREYSFHSR